MPKPVNPLPALVGQPQGRMLDALLRPIGQIITDVLLPGIGHPAPQGIWSGCVGADRAIRIWLAPGGRTG